MKKYIIIAGLIIALPIVILFIFSISTEIQYRYLQKVCTREALQGMSLQEIREKFHNYPSKQRPVYHDEKSVSELFAVKEFFAVSELFDFRGCFIAYDIDTLEIKDVRFVSD